MAERIYNIGIIGGGRGGLELLNMFIRSYAANILFVCDKNSTAPAICDAQSKNIKTFTDFNEALKLKPDYILEATGSAQVFELLSKAVASTSIKIIPNDIAHFFFSVLQNLREEDEDDALNGKFLTFKLQHEDYAVPLNLVREVINWQSATPIPNTPKWFKGMIDLRGEMLPVIDLHHRLEIGNFIPDINSCIIMVQNGERAVGIIANKVSDVVQIDKDKIAPVESNPLLANKIKHELLTGIGLFEEQPKLILDVSNIIRNI